MKRKKIAIITTLFLCLLPWSVCLADNPCAVANQITIDDRLIDPQADLDYYLTNYSDVQPELSAHYLNFNFPSPLPVDQTFAVTLPAGSTKDLYICNINIAKSSGFSSGTNSLLTITNASAKNIYISNLTMGGIIQGLKIIKTSTGSISVADASITGDSSKSGSCLNVAASGATITGGTFTNCAKGIQVQADNVRIQDARIHDNKYGVYVDAGISGVNIRESLIYSNDSGTATDRRMDGIYYVDESARDLQFYDVQAGVAVNLSSSSSAELNYENRTPYILLPEMPTSGSTVEFFTTSPVPCFMQACATGSAVSIDYSTILTGGIVTSALPPSLVNQSIVAIYSHPELGSTIISKAFVTSSPDIIAFVATPYDIPTSGGNVADSGPEVGDADSGSDDEAEAQSGSDSSSGSGTQMASGEGSGGGGPVDVGNLTDSVGTGATGAKCTLVVGDTLRSVSIVANLWWLIFATGLLGGLRAVMVRIKRK